MNPADKAALVAISQGAVQGVLAPVHDLIRDLVGGAASELGDAWRDQVRVWRMQRALRFAGRTNEMLTQLRVSNPEIPLQVVLGAVEAASMEGDDCLQDR